MYVNLVRNQTIHCRLGKRVIFHCENAEERTGYFAKFFPWKTVSKAQCICHTNFSQGFTRIDFQSNLIQLNTSTLQRAAAYLWIQDYKLS